MSIACCKDLENHVLPYLNGLEERVKTKTFDWLNDAKNPVA
jgi:hypothetical protein